METNEIYHELGYEGEEIERILDLISDNSENLTDLLEKYKIDKELVQLILSGEDAIAFTNGEY